MKFKLSDVANVTMGQSPKSEFFNDTATGEPFLQGVRTFGRLYPTIDTYTTEYNRLATQGSILFSVRAPVGQLNWANQDIAIGRGLAAIAPVYERVNPDYLYYLLKSMGAAIDSQSNGTVFTSINKTELNNLDLKLPELAQQEKVGTTLRLLDEKIESLSEINDNLLDLSMTHFEHWLETTSSTNNVSLDEIATYKNGLAMQKFEPEDVADSLPVLKIRELNQGFTDSSSNRVRTDIDDSVKVYDGDVIFSWSGTLLVDIWTGGSAGLNQHLFKVTSTAYPKWFYYMWTRYHLRQFQQIAAGKATTMGHIKRGDLKSADVIIPTDSEFTQLETLLKPVVAAYIENGVEIKNLQTIRDQLLQKLLG